ncbi:MAG: GGDEF domain-containing protein [Actinomycetota bacterium]|nr:GGDEF domain-containing protein [Actinomycetota bacterium]
MRHAFQRMGGPVWTMLLWCGAYIASSVVRAFQFPSEPGTWLPEVGVQLVIVGVLLAWRERTPAWFLKAAALIQVAATVSMAIRTTTPVAIGTFVAVLYSGIWWRGWFPYNVAALSSVGYLVAIHVGGMIDELAETWFLMTGMLFGIALGLSLVVGEVTRAATHDSLTHLLNRNGLRESFRIHPRPGRAALPRTLISIDLDGLKVVNDASGHQAGDRLLREFAAVLRGGLRPDDLAVRMGGDEFLVILAQTAPSDTSTLVSRLREQSPGPWSCGVTDWAPDESFEAALARADVLLYEDKRFRQALAAR